MKDTEIERQNQYRRLMAERDLLLSAIAPADYAKIQAHGRTRLGQYGREPGALEDRDAVPVHRLLGTPPNREEKP